MGPDNRLYRDKGVKEGVTEIKLDNDGFKRLATGISVLAVSDLDLTYGKVMKLHKACCKEGVCDTEQLVRHLIKIRAWRNGKSLPFGEAFEYSALEYFGTEWGRSLLDGVGISYLPKDFLEKLNLLWNVHKRCRPCITRHIKDAEERLKTVEEYSAALKG